MRTVITASMLGIIVILIVVISSQAGTIAALREQIAACDKTIRAYQMDDVSDTATKRAVKEYGR